jgi:hypothetical protein
MNKYEKYLGLPILVGKSRSQAFKSINDKVWNRLYNWKIKALFGNLFPSSMGGIRAQGVAQSVGDHAS